MEETRFTREHVQNDGIPYVIYRDEVMAERMSSWTKTMVPYWRTRASIVEVNGRYYRGAEIQMRREQRGIMTHITQEQFEAVMQLALATENSDRANVVRGSK